MKCFLLVATTIVVLIAALIYPAGAQFTDNDMPPQLREWRSWVMYGHETSFCPSRYNDAATVLCQWPSQLKLDVMADGAQFQQHWLMFVESWAALPGGGSIWPESVTVDGRAAAVVSHHNLPAVRLTPGEHRVQGRFAWHRRPEMIPLVPAVGLFSLSIDGNDIAAPMIDDQGQVWLQASRSETLQEDAVRVRIYRLIDDSVPMTVQTHIRLDVFGKAREIELPAILLQGSTPMTLGSPLPARIYPDGKLTLQARPGQWEIQINARLSGPHFKLNAGPCPYGDEIWSFQPHHALRMVEILDVPPVEPSQTQMPVQWRKFTAFIVKAGSAMVFKEIRRGDPEPAPDQLALKRTWWLDFNGQGFTVRDEIAGTISRQWHLAMNAPVLLGRVVVDGEDRVITEQGPQKKMGVELRRGHLSLQADSRIPERTGALAAVGWDHDFQSVSGKLNLPPGWRLLAARGIDKVSHSWILTWSLLDFFMVLIIALTVLKLRNWQWGLVALVAMVLIFHEPGAPRFVWLHILVVLALLPALPDGWFKRVVRVWGLGAVIVLMLVVIPFVVNQIRWGVYPQLALSGGYTGSGFLSDTMDSVVSTKWAEEAEPPMPMRDAAVKAKPARAAKSPMSSSLQTSEKQLIGVQHQQVDLIQQDPEALIPTGPGLPDWQWQAIDLGWSGPVAKEQQIKFYLISPLGNLVLTFLRVGFLLLFIWALIDWRSLYFRCVSRLAPAAAAILCLCTVIVLQANVSRAEQSMFPPPSLLEELRQRLLEKPDCYPACADISRMEIAADGSDIQVMLKVSCADRVAVPLPIGRKSWTPEQVMMDYAPISGLANDKNGQLWAMVPPGLHTIVLRGSAVHTAVIRFPLLLKPRTAVYSATGWRLEGIHADGTTGSSIQMTRMQDEPEQAVENSGLPPFLEVVRTLQLGLTWHTTTTIRRITDTGIPIVASVPLLAGESITTEGVTIEQGAALINMAASQKVLTYHAVLPITPALELVAPKAVPWTESWVLDAGSVWHCDLEGIPVIHHQDAAGQWQPQWRPWPGEKVTIRVHQPKSVPGQTKTIDAANLVLTPGKRYGDGKLSIVLRTSRGGQHTLTLPQKANLQKVALNGRSLPIRQDGVLVTVPLPPGEQRLELQWHQLAPFSFFFRAPLVEVGQKAVNTRITFHMPAQRWILLAGGPTWGPAVLFWSYFIAIVIAAVLLGRVKLTPIKTWQWVLLGLGLTQVPAAMALLIGGWLLALAIRGKLDMPRHGLAFNAIQIGLVVWSCAALISLLVAVQSGLTGAPEMQIVGNGSSHTALHWTQDHSAGPLARPWVLSLPVWAYRVMMFVWSLWLAWTLLGWLKWGWHCLGNGGMWRKGFLWKKRQKQAEA